MYEFIEQLKKKPAHVRERIAYGVAGGVSGFVFLVWLVVFFVSGPLTVSTDPAVIAKEQAGGSASPKSSFSEMLASVGSAFSGTSTDTSTNGKTSGITIVNAPAATSSAPADPTVLPF